MVSTDPGRNKVRRQCRWNQNVCAAPPVNNLDQRGFVRPGVGATNCSIGAYEFNSARCGDVNGDGVVQLLNRRL